MFNPVKFEVSDYKASKAFFLKALEPLGVAVVSEEAPTYGVELSPKGKASLCLYQIEEKPAHLHLALTAQNRQQVEAFYHAALEAGSKFLIVYPTSRRNHPFSEQCNLAKPLLTRCFYSRGRFWDEICG